MKIGDEVLIHGYVDEIRNDCIIIKNKGGYFGTVAEEVRIDCETCGHWWRSEEVCLLDDCHYEPKTEPQTEEAFPCDGCKWENEKWDSDNFAEHCDGCCKSDSHYEPKDEHSGEVTETHEPQTERSE